MIYLWTPFSRETCMLHSRMSTEAILKINNGNKASCLTCKYVELWFERFSAFWGKKILSLCLGSVQPNTIPVFHFLTERPLVAFYGIFHQTRIPGWDVGEWGFVSILEKKINDLCCALVAHCLICAPVCTLCVLMATGPLLYLGHD